MKSTLPLLALCLCLFSILVAGGCTGKENCENSGGSWHRVWLTRGECNFRTQDSGTICRDGSQCEGECVLDENAHGDDLANVTGRCSEWRSVYGCYRYVTNGEASGYFCYE